MENLNEWNTSNVTDMSMMFEASKINQPIRFDTRNVITMYSMFYEAKHFNSPLNFDTRNVQNIEGYVLWCTSNLTKN
nr:BspA family leucine-rich repeat surface protein [Mycoplasmopsis bovis]